MDRSDIEKAVGAAVPAQKAPAIGMSITCNVGQDRQMVLQTFIDQEAPDMEANALADRLMIIAERQSARARIPILEVEIEDQKRNLATYLEQAARRALERAQKTSELDEKIIAAKTAVDEEFGSGYDEHVKAGRRGEYVPKGSRASAISAKNAEVEKLFDERKKIADEAEQDKIGAENTRKHFEVEIKAREARIAECKRLVG